MAYAEACILCHEIDPDAKIGPNSAYMMYYPVSCNPKDIRAAQEKIYIDDLAYLDIYVRGEYGKYLLNKLEKIQVAGFYCGLYDRASELVS